MFRDIDKASSGVLKVGAVALTVSPAIIISSTLAVSGVILASAVCYKLVTSGKMVKFSIKDVFHFQAEFN